MVITKPAHRLRCRDAISKDVEVIDKLLAAGVKEFQVLDEGGGCVCRVSAEQFEELKDVSDCDYGEQYSVERKYWEKGLAAQLSVSSYFAAAE